MSGTELTVHVNRGTANTLEADTQTLETDRRVRLVLRGHDRPAHVHCRLEGDLDRVARIEQSNYYIEPEQVTTVPIAIDNGGLEEPIEGHLEVVTGYGSESVAIELTVRPPPPEVEVDETLRQPDRQPREPGAFGRTLTRLREEFGVDSSALAVVGLAVLAIGVATMTAATVGGFVAYLGLVFVVVGVLVALWLVLA
ncbi:DUF7524 family protein [Halopiger goleimassiliensis]|uniref:DUF7524 family protein n=1 Tax=Halopiger goleimassiliensis TaxID=1293048 RepID=UPI0006775E2A|nr:hypothetical protein [Halopiger goleimassiliensis]